MKTNIPLATYSKRTLPLAYSLLPAGDAVEISEDSAQLDLNALVTGGREGFVAYAITGDSMLESIRPGDIVVVDTWREPKNGDIIVASVNGQNSIKVLEHNPHGLFLVPKNGEYKRREITYKDNFQVIGVVKWHLAPYG